jgi:DNA helicase-2/ATP-dependent DNA helicase PcrA
MLKFAYDDGNRELFLRFYYKLDLKVKKAVVAQILQHMRRNESVFEVLLDSESLEPWQKGKVKALQTHFSKLPQMSSYLALQRLVKFMGYGDYLEEQHADTARLDVLLTLANQTAGIPEFLERLEQLKGLLEGMKPRPECPFVLSTIHASKGLEYDRVILMDAAQGIFPSLAEEDAVSQEERDALEEERRLFYVGATRARHQLELLCYEAKFGREEGVRFPFVEQLLGEEPKKEREKKILILRYGLAGGDEMTQKEVADLLGISQSYISRLEKKIIGRLRCEMARQM